MKKKFLFILLLAVVPVVSCVAGPALSSCFVEESVAETEAFINMKKERFYVDEPVVSCVAVNIEDDPDIRELARCDNPELFRLLLKIEGCKDELEMISCSGEFEYSKDDVRRDLESLRNEIRCMKRELDYYRELYGNDKTVKNFVLFSSCVVFNVEDYKEIEELALINTMVLARREVIKEQIKELNKESLEAQKTLKVQSRFFCLIKSQISLYRELYGQNKTVAEWDGFIKNLGKICDRNQELCDYSTIHVMLCYQIMYEGNNMREAAKRTKRKIERAKRVFKLKYHRKQD